jgi:CHAD domain-containing protein
MYTTQIFPGVTAISRIEDEILFSHELLLDKTCPDEIKVYRLSKSIKRLRSMIRLIRPVLPFTNYYRLENLFHEAGENLSPMRDATVSYNLFQKLADETSYPISSILYKKIASVLKARKCRVYDNEKITLAASGLRQIPVYLKPERIEGFSYQDLKNSLDQSHIHAAEAYRDAFYTMENEIIHTWRKRSRDLLLQLKFASFASIPEAEFFISHLEKVTHTLGKYNDLCMLEKFISDNIDLSKKDSQLIHLIISRSKARFQKIAFSMGETLFSRENFRLFSSACVFS